MRTMSEKPGNGHLAIFELQGDRGEAVPKRVERDPFKSGRMASSPEQFGVGEVTVPVRCREHVRGFVIEKWQRQDSDCRPTDRPNLLPSLCVTKPEERPG